jgi:two-component system response regulator HydG
MAHNGMPGVWNDRDVNLLLEARAEGVFTMDAHGRITSWNPAMARLTGYTREEALGQTCQILSFDRCFEKDCPQDAKRCGILDGGQVDAKECQLRHRDGCGHSYESAYI